MPYAPSGPLYPGTGSVSKHGGNCVSFPEPSQTTEVQPWNSMSEPCSQALFPYGVVTIWRKLSCLRLWLDRYTMNVRLKNFVLTDIDWWTILRLPFLNDWACCFFRDLNHDLLLERTTPSYNQCQVRFDRTQGTLEAVQTGGVQELDAIQHFPQQPTGLARGRLTVLPASQRETKRCFSFSSKSSNQTGHGKGKFLDDQRVFYGIILWMHMGITKYWTDLQKITTRSHTTCTHLI